MSPAEYAAWIRSYAGQIGLDPNLAESIWRQESGGSLDTTLKGAALSRGRGNAVGPFQVVPYYHPNFPVEGDPIAQGKYALDYLKAVGPARYYGTGQAPAGHPTTDQYVQQVQARAARLGGVDVRQAALGPDPGTMSTDTPQPQPTGDPMTGMMDPRPQWQPNPMEVHAARLGGVDVRQAARAPDPGTLSTDTPQPQPTGDPMTGVMDPRPQWQPNPMEVHAAQQQLEALRGRYAQRPDAAAPFGLADALAIAAQMAMGGGSALDAVGDWASARRSVDEAEYKRKAQAAADFSTTARAEAALADMEDRLARKRWAASLPPEDRALVEAGYGDEVAKQRLAPPPERKPPTIRDFAVGDQTVAMQWDPVRGWVRVAQAPRWAPPAPPAPPSGYTVTPTGLAPIPGGPADPKPQAGYAWAEQGNPGAGVVPVAGGEKAEAVREEIAAMQNAIRNVDRLGTLTGNWKNSTLGAGDGKKYGEAGTLVAALQSALFKAWGLGVPQQGDYEMVAKAIPDPTSWGSLLDSDKTMEARAKALKLEFANRIRFLRKEPMLPGDEEMASKRALLMETPR